jgi:hypothetical protein
MTGTHVSRIAQLIVRQHTYNAIVSPAIADLQYEADRGRFARLRAYIAVWRTLAVAFAGELTDDCADAWKGVDVGSLTCAVFVPLAIASAPFVPTMWAMYGRSARPWHHDAVLLAVAGPGLLVMVGLALAMPGAAMLARHSDPGSRRAAVLITVLIAALLGGIGQAARWHTGRIWFDMYYTSNTSLRAGDQDRPLWELHGSSRDNARRCTREIPERASDGNVTAAAVSSPSSISMKRLRTWRRSSRSSFSGSRGRIVEHG